MILIYFSKAKYIGTVKWTVKWSCILLYIIYYTMYNNGCLSRVNDMSYTDLSDGRHGFVKEAVHLLYERCTYTQSFSSDYLGY